MIRQHHPPIEPDLVVQTVHYKRAPIAEAVIDLQVSFDEAPSFESIEAFARGFATEFPQTQPINEISMAVSQDGHSGEMSTNCLGMRLTSAAGDRVFQVRRQGFSYSHLQPYTAWEQFSEEMRPLWQRFVEAFKPKTVYRLAVRYINRIPMSPGEDVDLYLNVTPRTLSDICPNIEGYFMQLVVPQHDLGNEWKAIINTGLEATPSPKDVSVLLDIDLFCMKTVLASDEEIWPILNQLRDRKNKIFESAITDKVRERIL